MIIHFQIRPEIALFCRFEHFKYILLIKLSLWCAVFVGLWIICFIERVQKSLGERWVKKKKRTGTEQYPVINDTCLHITRLKRVDN